jgi:hypothetical protein
MCLFLFYSSHQLSELENLFIRNKYPDVGNRAEISRAIGLAEQCIRVRRDPPNCWILFSLLPKKSHLMFLFVSFFDNSHFYPPSYSISTFILLLAF